MRCAAQQMAEMSFGIRTRIFLPYCRRFELGSPPPKKSFPQPPGLARDFKIDLNEGPTTAM